LLLLYVLPDRTIYQISFPWLFLTLLGQIIGVLIILGGIWQTGFWHFVGLTQLLKHPPVTDSILDTTRLYAWVRHPLYFGAVLVIWLMPVMTLNYLTLFVALTIYLVVGAKLEERRLVKEYGAAYTAYQKQVSLMIPRKPRKH
jgi:protein-S-isoprenylcysteine O-methyltransferase Ste14